MNLNLPVHSYNLPPASTARLVNCYAEQLPAGAKTPVQLKRAPGIKPWFESAGFGEIKAMYTKPISFKYGSRRDYLWVVNGSNVHFITKSLGNALVGTVGRTTGRVDIVSNTDSLVFVVEPRAYYYDGQTFGEITDENFVSRGSGDVEFIDDFLLHREPNSSRFFAADLGTTNEFYALNLGIADHAPDELNGMIAEQGQAILFGNESTEIWENIGSSGFPFARTANGTIEVGCHNAETVDRTFNIVFWVADDLTVRRLDGLAPTRVSTHAIEQKLREETILSAFTYEMEGHFFYALSTSEGTYVYDVVTQEWHERQSYLNANWIPRSSAVFDGKVLVGDPTQGRIGELDPDTYMDWNGTQRMEWTYQPVWAEGQRAFHDRLEIVLETGVGNTLPPGDDPKIMLSKSDDGGKTWQALPDKTFGKRGERLSRAVWHNLGSARQRVYRAAVSDPVPVTVTSTLIEVRGGRL